MKFVICLINEIVHNIYKTQESEISTINICIYKYKYRKWIRTCEVWQKLIWKNRLKIWNKI